VVSLSISSFYLLSFLKGGYFYQEFKEKASKKNSLRRLTGKLWDYLTTRLSVEVVGYLYTERGRK